MKLSAVLLIALAVIIAVVPPLTECAREGKALATADGRQVPMKCHWTAIASMAMAVPLLATGVMQWFSKRKETRRSLSILGAIMGAFVILFPTALIGVSPPRGHLQPDHAPDVALHGRACDWHQPVRPDCRRAPAGAGSMSLGRLVLRNISGSTFRSSVVFLCALLVAGLALSTVLIVHGAEESLRLASRRLGADIVVVPEGTEAKIGTALLMGMPTKTWMPQDTLDKIARVPGVAEASPHSIWPLWKTPPAARRPTCSWWPSIRRPTSR